VGITNGLIFHVTTIPISRGRQSLLPSRTLQKKSHFTMLVCEYRLIRDQTIGRATKVELTCATGYPTSLGVEIETRQKFVTSMSLGSCILLQQRKIKFSLPIVIHTLLPSYKLSFRN
jgi:hypothetical protein